ncbi:tauropine dehydrogenase-like isoform X3 [Montipora foliosa]|uniref:tauropine dehydrogenase-like isoform X3 n=1 Tax=Montipora foliosa TaxID=591990 RepID=UPI0035F1DD0A
MEDSSEDETCNQCKASSEKEEGEIQAKEQKDEEYDVKPGDNDSSANGGRRGGGGGGGGGGKRSLAKKLAITGLVGVGVTAVGVIAAPVIATTALGAAGFTASGVAAGSAAAAIQSSFFGGSVLSGSLFALCQSAGATGVISTATTGLIGGTTGLAGAGTTWGISKFFGRNTPPTPKLLICGSDAGAHVLAGIASSKEGTSVRVLCLDNDVAQQWNSAIRARNIEVTFPSTETPSRISSKPSLITKSKRDALQDIDIVVFMLPTNDHPIYFRALKNYVKPGTVIVGLPGNPRFMALGRELLCPTGWKCTFISFESLPWDCQITEFGTKCEVLSTRESLSGEIEEGDVSPRMEPVTTLQYLLGPRPNLTIARNRHL